MAELIIALDHADAPGAVALLDQLPDRCAVKVGAVMMTRAGLGFVRSLVANGHTVFLDLKWHDIPNTVVGAVEAAADLGVEMATVHALGGAATIEAAVTAAAGRLRIVAVTLLTSHDVAAVSTILGRELAGGVGPEVVRLAACHLGRGRRHRLLRGRNRTGPAGGGAGRSWCRHPTERRSGRRSGAGLSPERLWPPAPPTLWSAGRSPRPRIPPGSTPSSSQPSRAGRGGKARVAGRCSPLASRPISLSCAKLAPLLSFHAIPQTRVRGDKRVKVRSSVKPICESCRVVKRRGVTRIICKRTPKHKQRQG